MFFLWLKKFLIAKSPGPIIIVRNDEPADYCIFVYCLRNAHYLTKIIG